MFTTKLLKHPTIPELRDILDSAGSQIFHVSFIKRDGTIRDMSCQIPAVETHRAVNPEPSHLQGANTRREKHPELFLVYDLDEKAIRSFDVTRLVSATVNHQRFEFPYPHEGL